MSRNTDWMDIAACRDHPTPDIFFPDSPGVGGRRQAFEAQQICNTCPVIESCRAHKQHTGASLGVWGGKHSPNKRVRASVVVLHGTEAGAGAHRRNGERPCPSCLRAESRVRTERQHRRKTS